ncbi:MAG: PEP-CTERM sorting domain-containing protein [Rubrivivax sp.]|nr:PEP-CTERM sorting domain-containing protein [Rubrivivax sp.]
MPAPTTLSRRLLTLFATLAAAGAVHAVPITFTFEAVGGGSLGTQGFADTAFTIVTTADTDDIVVGPNGRRVANATAWITLASGPVAQFTGDIVTVVNSTLSSVGVSDFAVNRAILFLSHPDAGTYDLASSTGPLTGTAFVFNTGFQHGTTLGPLVLNEISAASFTAAVVPEPASAALLLSGGAALLGWRRRVAAAA